MIALSIFLTSLPAYILLTRKQNDNSFLEFGVINIDFILSRTVLFNLDLVSSHISQTLELLGSFRIFPSPASIWRGLIPEEYNLLFYAAYYFNKDQ